MIGDLSRLESAWSVQRDADTSVQTPLFLIRRRSITASTPAPDTPSIDLLRRIVKHARAPLSLWPESDLWAGPTPQGSVEEMLERTRGVRLVALDAEGRRTAIARRPRKTAVGQE